MSGSEPTAEATEDAPELRRQLDEAKQTIQALLGGQVDAVATSAGTTPVLLAAAHEELTRSQALLRAVFDGALDAMILFDDAGKFVDVNPATCALFGRPREGLVGHVGADYYDTFDTPAVRQRLHAVGQLRGELKVRRPDGETRDVEFSGRTHIAPGLHFTIFRDVTALRRAEGQLRQAQKLEAVGRLAGGVAHDFNNLLSIILSYTDLILDALKPDDPLRADLEEVKAAGLRSTDLTRQLLAFSRRQVLQPRVLVLNEIVTGMERMVRRLLGEGITLSLVPSPTLGRAEVDPGQIEQVILNLAVNARDAMPRGGELTIATANVHLDGTSGPEGVKGSFVCLTVTDTGSGIDAATRSHIFEPFFTTKDVGQGTGLGLATVLGIVQQSLGHIEVVSEPGKGATFRVYFPRTDWALDTALSMAPPASAAGGETVLVVEDEEQVRAIVVRVLRRSGYQVLEAANGGEALLLCEQHPRAIHLMVTDVVMPRFSGPQLAERVRALRPEMRVLYMSGYTDDEMGHHGVLDPSIAFLQKPITPDGLVRKVREVLDAAVKGRAPAR